MINIIIAFGLVTYSLLLATLIFMIIFKIKKKGMFYKLHRGFGITTGVLATIHAILAGSFFYGLI